MEIEKLRLGNIVEQGYISTIQYQDGYMGCYIHKHCYDSSCGDWYKSKDITPIELNEEWLVKFGAKKLDYKQYNLNGLIIQKKKNGYMTWVNNNLPVEIKHVHRLQNLYFALTGEEL